MWENGLIRKIRLISKSKVEGILQPIFHLDINTQIDRKQKNIENLLKKLFFQNF